MKSGTVWRNATLITLCGYYKETFVLHIWECLFRDIYLLRRFQGLIIEKMLPHRFIRRRGRYRNVLTIRELWFSLTRVLFFLTCRRFLLTSVFHVWDGVVCRTDSFKVFMSVKRLRALAVSCCLTVEYGHVLFHASKTRRLEMRPGQINGITGVLSHCTVFLFL